MYFCHKRITVRRLLISLTAFFSLSVWFCSAGETNRSVERILPEDFLSTEKFSYFEDKLFVSFDLRFAKSVTDFSTVLLKSESSKHSSFFILLDGSIPKNQLTLFLGKDMQIRKEVLMPDSSLFQDRSVPVFLELDMRKDMLRCCLTPGDTSVFTDIGLSVNDGYKFSMFIDSLNNQQRLYPERGVALQNLDITACSNDGKGTSVYWYILIVVIDVLIFAFMYYRRRYRKRLAGAIPEQEEVLARDPALMLRRPSLPVKSAIYLFGGMRIFNRDGEDISKKFSPILKELLALLIVHSDKKGISADKMKSYLWHDKTLASARNNRAVNLGKLRNLLSEVGDFEIKSDDGYWRIDSGDIFMDYLTYRNILKNPGIIAKEEIEILCVIASEGNILPEQQYEWLDTLRGTISDDIFDKFLGFAETLDEENAADLYIGIADVMFKFESINEQALALKCRAYSRSGRHSAAKIFYDKFCDEYRLVYGEEFSISFADILKSSQSEINARTV